MMNNKILFLTMTLFCMDAVGSSLNSLNDIANLELYINPKPQSKGFMNCTCPSLGCCRVPAVFPWTASESPIFTPLMIGSILNKTPYWLRFYDRKIDKDKPAYKIAPGCKQYPLDAIGNSQYVVMDGLDANKQPHLKDQSQFYVEFVEQGRVIENSTMYVNAATNTSSSENRKVNIEKRLQVLAIGASFPEVHEKVWQFGKCKKWNTGKQSDNCAACDEENQKAKTHKSVQFDMYLMLLLIEMGFVVL